MKNEYEFVTHDKLKHIHIFLNTITYRSFHLHNDFELLCITEGQGKINTRGSTLPIKKGDIILLNSNEAHEIDAGGSAITAVILQFSNHFLQNYYYNIRNIVFQQESILPCLPEQKKLKLWEMVRQAALSYVNAASFFELSCVAAVAEILILLLDFVPHKILNEKEYMQRKKLSERINRISSYLEENYQMPVRLQDIAVLEQITPTHLSHFFSENFGVTFQEYLNSIRFEHAVRLLESSSLSLSDVAVSSGFSELKYMTNMFLKRLGCKPGAFRSRVLDFKVSDMPTQLSSILEYHHTPEESQKILTAINLNNHSAIAP